MKKGKKKSSIIDRAKSNMEENRKKQKLQKIFKKLFKYFNTFNGRFVLIFLFTVIGFAALIGRVYYLQTKGGQKIREDSEKKYSYKTYKKAKRGKISTSDGQVLAYDNEDYFVILDPTLIDEENIDTLLEMLKRYIESLDIQKYKLEYLEKKKAGRQYLKIENKISYRTKIEIESEIDNDKNEAIKRKKEKYKRRFKGIVFETVFTRNYVQNDAFQETLGFVNNENKGVYGIEKYYDKQLAGEMGVEPRLRIPKPFLEIVKVKNKNEAKTAVEGNNLVLTLDSVMQYNLDEELQKAFVDNNASAAMGIMIEVETGKILAMSSYPKAEDKATIKNRTITDFFEPGSIFKPITVAIGLDSKTINENTKIYSAGSIKVYDTIVRDHDSSTIGTLGLADIVAHSGNVAMVKIQNDINKNTFYRYLVDVGLGGKTDIDTYFESMQKLREFKTLKDEVRRANIAFGQGIAVTQIQMIMALNTVINNGKLMKPYLVDRIEDTKGNIVKQNKPDMIKKVFSDEASRLNRKYMEASVNRGTGGGAYIPGYRVGGKTGTAQKAGKEGYKNSHVSSFFAFFPADKPKYAILITISEPKGGKYYGAEVALPSVRRVLEKLIEYKRIQPNGKVKTPDKNIIGFVQQEKKKDLGKIKQDFEKNIMPDLTGISLREFLSIYPQGKFAQYEITGSGAVVSQFPEKGTKLDRQTKIQIMLE
ncbi:penicillin-binding transpeptidase domain-containing protein [Leptotrichia trevisanii]|uniref:Peptidoglycan glycosyltransferase n=1 Tax=Leptotrichia trevisanii TaxID=109328 RepID=A0A510JYK1_9FUSO|nr:penicillin-binding transpeptidase domain-containing protein [Leptotrichia trevisanii]BBM44077.1 peptidoglycan glycosyltransferase [Leptotrichia trevisanii]